MRTTALPDSAPRSRSRAPARRSDACRDFRPSCSAARRPRISRAIGRASSPPSPPSAWAFLTSASPAPPKIRLRARPGRSPRRRRSLEIVNDDMPFLVDSVMGELQRARPRVRLVVHPVFTVERDAAGRLDRLRGARMTVAARRESFIHIHVERIDGRRAARRDRARARSASSPRCACACTTGGRCWRASREVIAELQANPPPLPADEIAEAIHSSNGWSPTISPSSACATTPTPTTSSALEPMFETGLGLLRSPDVRVLRRGDQLVTDHAGDPRVPRTSRRCSSSPRPTCARACTGASTWTISASSASMPTASSIGEFRIVGLFTSTAYTRSTRAIPYLRRKVDDVVDARRLRSRTAIPARRWSTCWRPIRATSCSRSTRTRSTTSRSPSCSSTSGRACACCRGATASTASSRCSSTCRATATTATSAQAIGDYLAAAYNGRVSRLLSVLSRRPAGARAFHHRRATSGKTPNPDRADARRAVDAIVRTWTDGLARGARGGTRAEQGARAVRRAIATPSPIGYREAYLAADRGRATSRMIEALTARAPARRRFLPPQPADDDACAGLKVWSHDAADPAVRARAGAGEHGLPRRRRAHLSDRAARRRTPTSGSTT